MGNPKSKIFEIKIDKDLVDTFLMEEATAQMASEHPMVDVEFEDIVGIHYDPKAKAFVVMLEVPRERCGM